MLCEDTRVSKKLFSLIEQKLNTLLDTKNKKFIALHSHNENEFFQDCNIDFSQNIAYISDAGSPCISDPGAMLVDFCIKNNIEYDFIGGTSAFLVAFAMSGFLNTSFLFYGFLPKKGKVRYDELKNLLDMPYCTILYEAPHRIERLIQDIIDIDENRILFAIKEISKMHQTSLRDSAINIRNKLESLSKKGEWCVVISANEESINKNPITMEDIDSLSIPPKQKAKLVAKVTGESVKDCYMKIMES